MWASSSEKFLKFAIVDDIRRPVVFGNPLDKMCTKNKLDKSYIILPRW
jgi:hypothetical protein